MDYLREYKKFIYSYYFSHGMQTSFCIILPSILGYYFGQLNYGILFSVGALCVSSIDTPGPPSHRRNSLLAGSAVIFIAALFMCSYLISDWTGNFFILLLIFLLSMAAVFGNRASNVGMAGIYAIILATEQKENLQGYILNAFLFLGGATWYALISLLTYRFRPFQLIQQALSEAIYQSAEYLRTRAEFYSEHVDYLRSYDKLIKQQVEVNNAQGVARNLLLKRRMATKESTVKGRSLLMILLEIIDIYEQVMAAHIDVEVLQNTFKGTGILPAYQLVILALARELDQVAAAVAAGRGSMPKTNIGLELDHLQSQTHKLRDKNMTRDNISAFITLRNVRRNVSLINEKIQRLHRFTRYKEEGQIDELDLPAFADQEQYSWEKFKSNFGRHSIYFRHAVRVTSAVLAGLLISEFFPVQRSYWILFTLVVILKPGFSLSKKRNSDRIIGTLCGAVLAIAVLVFIKQSLILFAILVVCMVITYSFSTINYVISTFSTTIFVLLFFNFLKPGDFSFVKLRLIDTGIGSLIALASSYFIFPVWEYKALDILLISMLESNKAYFFQVSKAYTGEIYDLNQYKLARKAVYVNSANLSSAFQRMLSEPKSKQTNAEEIHQFVVLNHLFSSYTATLASYIGIYSRKYPLEVFKRIRDLVSKYLNNALESIQGKDTESNLSGGTTLLTELNNELEDLRLQRLEELREGSIEESGTRQRLSELGLLTDQFRFILKVSKDILKVSILISAK